MFEVKDKINFSALYSGMDCAKDCFDKKHFKNYTKKISYQYNSKGFRDNEWPDDLSNVTHEDIPTGERVYAEMNTEIVMHGMIAQDVKAALDIEGVDTFGGWKVSECGEQSLGKSMFVFPLIKAVQELSAKIDTMQEEINNLKE